MLDRFLDAQRGDYAAALAEVRRGRKTSHWMWYIFPQIAGLGQSSTARYYSIRDLEEAREYYAHPVLGQRLREISGALLELRGSDPVAVFGGIDSMKLKSSMTSMFCRSSSRTRQRSIIMLASRRFVKPSLRPTAMKSLTGPSSVKVFSPFACFFSSFFFSRLFIVWYWLLSSSLR